MFCLRRSPAVHPRLTSDPTLFFTTFQMSDEAFMAIYSMEFLMKIYVEPIMYWRSGYNVFDAVILLLSYIPMFTGDASSSLATISVFRSCRALRVLKSVSFIRGLQVKCKAHCHFSGHAPGLRQQHIVNVSISIK